MVSLKINEIPLELQVEVSRYLTQRELLTCLHVNHDWNQLFNHDIFWKPLLDDTGIHLPDTLKTTPGEITRCQNCQRFLYASYMKTRWKQKPARVTCLDGKDLPDSYGCVISEENESYMAYSVSDEEFHYEDILVLGYNSSLLLIGNYLPDYSHMAYVQVWSTGSDVLLSRVYSTPRDTFSVLLLNNCLLTAQPDRIVCYQLEEADAHQQIWRPKSIRRLDVVYELKFREDELINVLVSKHTAWLVFSEIFMIIDAKTGKLIGAIEIPPYPEDSPPQFYVAGERICAVIEDREMLYCWNNLGKLECKFHMLGADYSNYHVTPEGYFLANAKPPFEEDAFRWMQHILCVRDVKKKPDDYSQGAYDPSWQFVDPLGPIGTTQYDAKNSIVYTFVDKRFQRGSYHYVTVRGHRQEPFRTFPTGFKVLSLVSKLKLRCRKPRGDSDEGSVGRKQLWLHGEMLVALLYGKLYVMSIKNNQLKLLYTLNAGNTEHIEHVDQNMVITRKVDNGYTSLCLLQYNV